jgi:ribulose-5-phosphate 4-epimerase/fuculose-1-phosphate aldolase
MSDISSEQQLVKLAHQLSPYAICAEGNISAKKQENFFIKSSGTSLHNLTVDSLSLCRISDGVCLNDRIPSIEASFHAWLFRNTSINFIAHTHPPNVLKIVCTDSLSDFAEKRLFPDQVIFNGAKSCIIPYAHPGIKLTEQIIVGVEKFLARENYFPSVILLKNHGLICCGSTAESCLYSTMMCEKAAEIFIGAKACFNIQWLSDAHIQALLNDDREKYRKKLVG